MEMKKHSKYDHLFVIIRININYIKDANMLSINNLLAADTLKVYSDESLAETEAERLNVLNDGKGYIYYVATAHDFTGTRQDSNP